LNPVTTLTEAPKAAFAHSASNLLGTLPDAKLSANVALRAGGNAFIGAQSFSGGNVDVQDAVVIRGGQMVMRDRPSHEIAFFRLGEYDYRIVSEGLFGDRRWSLADFTTGTRQDRLTINPVGMGIGTTTPGFLLHVNGSAGKPGGGSWSVASDERLKKNIRPLTGALDKLLAVHGVNFEYIEPEKIGELAGERTGLVAQEVEKVFPDWVETAPDGYKRVTVRGLEALVVEALRQLRSEKDNEIDQLKKSVAELKDMLGSKAGQDKGGAQ
jgi:hypothetical protein